MITIINEPGISFKYLTDLNPVAASASNIRIPSLGGTDGDWTRVRFLSSANNLMTYKNNNKK